MKSHRMVLIVLTMTVFLGLAEALSEEEGRLYIQDESVKHHLNSDNIPTSITCILVGEQTSGQNKLCIYECGDSKETITIGWNQFCPPSISTER